MFDLLRLGDTIQDLLGNVAGSGASANIAEQLGNLNLDPSVLSELGGADLMAKLGEHGIDINQLDPEQLNALTDQLGTPEVLPQLLELLGDRTP